MLFEVLPPHEHLLTEVTLQVLLARVGHHVWGQVSFLCEQFVTKTAAMILLPYGKSQAAGIKTGPIVLFLAMEKLDDMFQDKKKKNLKTEWKWMQAANADF